MLSLEDRNIAPVPFGQYENTVAAPSATLNLNADASAKPSMLPWHAKALEVVAMRVPELLGWPGEKYLELMNLATPETPVVKTSDSDDENNVIRLWRLGDSFSSGRAALAHPSSFPIYAGVDGFFEALAQEMKLGRFEPASVDSDIAQLHTALAEALKPSPPIIKLLEWLTEASIADIKAHFGPRTRSAQEGAIPATAQPDQSVVPQAASAGATGTEAQSAAAVDPAARRAADLLAEAVEASNWASTAGDLASQLITSTSGWPAGRTLKVCQPNAAPLIFGETREHQIPVEVWLEGQHYSARVNGRIVGVPGDGNCFFHAVVQAMGDEDAKAFTGAFDPAEQAARMRAGLADFVRSHPEMIAEWVDPGKLERELLPSLVADRGGKRDVPTSDAPASSLPFQLPNSEQISKTPAVEVKKSRRDTLKNANAALDELEKRAEKTKKNFPRKNFR